MLTINATIVMVSSRTLVVCAPAACSRKARAMSDMQGQKTFLLTTVTRRHSIKVASSSRPTIWNPTALSPCSKKGAIKR
jgi:hypothetical protein